MGKGRGGEGKGGEGRGGEGRTTFRNVPAPLCVSSANACRDTSCFSAIAARSAM